MTDCNPCNVHTTSHAHGLSISRKLRRWFHEGESRRSKAFPFRELIFREECRMRPSKNSRQCKVTTVESEQEGSRETYLKSRCIQVRHSAIRINYSLKPLHKLSGLHCRVIVRPENVRSAWESRYIRIYWQCPNAQSIRLIQEQNDSGCKPSCSRYSRCLRGLVLVDFSHSPNLITSWWIDRLMTCSDFVSRVPLRDPWVLHIFNFPYRSFL